MLVFLPKKLVTISLRFLTTSYALSRLLRLSYVLPVSDDWMVFFFSFCFFFTVTIYTIEATTSNGSSYNFFFFYYYYYYYDFNNFVTSERVNE